MKEEWRDIAGSEGEYQVSNLGRVRSLDRKIFNMGRGINENARHSISGRILRLPTRGGYLSVTICSSNKKTPTYVHRLVAQEFIGDAPDGCEVMHLDGNPENNAVDNLRYGSHQCNEAFKVDHGTHPCGEVHKNSKLTKYQVLRIREFSSVGILQKELSKTFSVSTAHISRVVTGKAWAHV